MIIRIFSLKTDDFDCYFALEGLGKLLCRFEAVILRNDKSSELLNRQKGKGTGEEIGEEKTETNGEGNALLLSLTLRDDVLTSGKLYLRQTSATKSFFHDFSITFHRHRSLFCDIPLWPSIGRDVCFNKEVDQPHSASIRLSLNQLLHNVTSGRPCSDYQYNLRI